MTAQLRSIWLSINASYWFYPALFSLIALALSLLTVFWDRNGAAEYLGAIEWLIPARPEGSRTVLSVIAGSMIGVAATVFSITLAAVTHASGTYGPRLLTNFMEDKANQVALGIFIAVFVYALLILRVVRSESETSADASDAAATALPGFTPQLSLLIATILALLGVAALVFVLHHIPATIRINTVLHGIGTRLLEDIDDRYCETESDEEPSRQRAGEPVLATKAGYIKIIEFASLDEIAKREEIVITLKIRTGDFIHAGVALFEISDDAPPQALVEELRQCIDTGSIRTAVQDLEFLFDELAEIALRALSPGINDPFTAITAIQWIGAATASLAHRDLTRGPEQDSYDRSRVRPLDDDFAHFLRRGFGGVRTSAAGSRIAALKFLDALARAAANCHSRQRIALLRAEGGRLVEQARIAMGGPALDEVEERFDEFSKTMHALAGEAQ